ncbi:MAG: YlbF family regulator [Clostridiales bacterium]|jgi:cell fate (sporulation/competence/biofilm development) regulator YlbF (YheA/YmcA/DUF963 family)|nr:YlbF family regulator [Clostridiales bacterium]
MEYFEKARELAKLLLETEEGKRAAAANEAFLAKPECVKKLSEFNSTQDIVMKKAQNGEYTEFEFKVIAEEAQRKFDDLQKEEVIAELFESSTAFNNLISKTMNVFSATVAGTDEGAGCSSCGGSCSGCH